MPKFLQRRETFKGVNQNEPLQKTKPTFYPPANIFHFESVASENTNKQSNLLKEADELQTSVKRIEESF